MTGTSFLKSKQNPVPVVDSFNHPSDISDSTFSSNINPHLVDSRAPNNVLSFDFILYLPIITTPSNSTTLPIDHTVQNKTVYFTHPPANAYDYPISGLSDITPTTKLTDFNFSASRTLSSPFHPNTESNNINIDSSTKIQTFLSLKYPIDILKDSHGNIMDTKDNRPTRLFL